VTIVLVNRTLKQICLCLFLSLLAAATSANAEIKGGPAAGKNSSVTIFINDATGAHVASGNGFIADERGMIATSCRLLTKWFEKVEYSISVELYNGTVYPMDHVISNSCINDLVMIKINAERLPAVKIAAGNKPRVRDRVYIISRGSDTKASVFNSVIKTVRTKSGIFHLGLDTRPQQDGSPVFNPRGEVVGILILPGKNKDRHIVVPAKNILKELSKCMVLEKDITATEPSPASVLAAPVPLRVPENGKGSAGVVVQNGEELALSRASSYDKSGLYKEAIKAYEQAIRFNPGRVDAYMSLGLDYYKIGNYSEAVHAYKQAIKIKPDEQSAYNKLAAAYILLGKYSMALDAFKESLKTDPHNPETHFNLGVAYIISGDKDGAISEYTILRDLDKNRADKLLELIY
jgi:TolA-binding protein